MRARVAALLALSGLLLSACDHGGSDPANAAKGQRVDKVLVTVIENKSFDQMRADAPKIWALGQKFGHATDFEAITHPSLPNYLAIAAGSTLGVTDDGEPDKHPQTGPSVFGNTIAAGRTAGIMADGMGPVPCDLNAHGEYVPRHVPWTYFVNEQDTCQKFVTDAQGFGATVAAGELPNVGMLIPDQCHNAHDCSLGDADNWVASKVEEAMTGPDWKSGKLAIVITADEDNRKAGNQVLTVVIHPSQDHHVVHQRLTIYSLHRLLAQVGRTDPLGEGVNAPDMAKAFGLRVG
jgi:acid phosphatase